MLREVIARFGVPRNLPMFYYLHAPNPTGSNKKARSLSSASRRDTMTLLEPTKTLNDYDVDEDVTISVLPDLLEEDSDRVVEAVIESMLGLPPGAVVSVHSTSEPGGNAAASGGCTRIGSTVEKRETMTPSSATPCGERNSVGATKPRKSSSNVGGLFSGFKRGFALPSSGKSAVGASIPTRNELCAASMTSDASITHTESSSSNPPGANPSDCGSSNGKLSDNSAIVSFKGMKRGFLNPDNSAKSTKRKS
jgi:hypothetical protein